VNLAIGRIKALRCSSRNEFMTFHDLTILTNEEHERKTKKRVMNWDRSDDCSPDRTVVLANVFELNLVNVRFDRLSVTFFQVNTRSEFVVKGKINRILRVLCRLSVVCRAFVPHHLFTMKGTAQFYRNILDVSDVGSLRYKA
jgi:hypothetical protein